MTTTASNILAMYREATPADRDFVFQSMISERAGAFPPDASHSPPRDGRSVNMLPPHVTVEEQLHLLDMINDEANLLTMEEMIGRLEADFADAPHATPLSER